MKPRNPSPFRAALALVAIAALAAVSFAPAYAQDAGETAPAAERGARRFHRARGLRGAMRGRMLRHAALRRMHLRTQAAEALALDDAQLRTVAEKAKAAQPIVAEARRERARLLVEARTTLRDATQDRETRKAAVRSLRERARAGRKALGERITPLARDVLATLTPEQRGRLEGFAAAHGRKLDEARLERRVGRWLARPMTADLCEARLGNR